MNNDDYIELERRDDDSFEFRSESVKPIKPWKAHFLLWSTVVGGIAIGTALFLFFLTLFIYFFVPLVIIAGLWALFKHLASHR